MWLALATPAWAQQVDQRLQTCIAHIIDTEAGNEPLEGKYMVAWSLVFRAAVGLAEFGGSDICDVAYKRSATVWQYDGAKITPRDGPSWSVSSYVAYMTLLGEGQPNMPVMYFCSIYVPGACRWHDRATDYVGTIGGHRFYLDRRFPALMEASAQ